MSEKRIAWVTDSTAFITDELRNHPDVYVLPLAIIFGEEAFDDGIDLTTDELYKRIREHKQVPKTSQPAAGRFQELYEKLKEEKYDCAISVHISRKLSGTYDSAASGAEMAGFEVNLVDSRSMSYAITTLIKKGMALAEQGETPEAIGEYLNGSAKKSQNYILLGSLDQFYKGGRMSGTQFLLGNLLKIKPIITITSDGEFDLFQKVRSEKKAEKRMVELLGESVAEHNVKHLQILHGNVRNQAEELREKITASFPDLDIFIGEISSSIAVHAGEGTLALMWHKEGL